MYTMFQILNKEFNVITRNFYSLGRRTLNSSIGFLLLGQQNLFSDSSERPWLRMVSRPCGFWFLLIG